MGISAAIGALIAGLTTAAPALTAGAAVGIGAASAAGAFDPKQPDPDAAKAAEKEARRKKLAELGSRKGRGASIVTGGAGLSGQKSSALGQSSILGSP
jgi:hypothetical protein